MVEPEEHPVASGLGALVGVGLMVGLILALMALVSTQVLGLGGDGSSSDGSPAAERTLYVPSPKKTPTPSGPLITLQPVEGTPTPEVTLSPEPTSASPSPSTGINLVAGQQSVAPMQRIDLSGSYPGGAGAVLQVQRFAGGGWTDFPVTVSVNGVAFSTYVETGQAGENRFRVLDPGSGQTSNEVSITVG